jgi:Tfp pilus assembly protein PilX
MNSEQKVPNERDISTLPYRARIAFGAQCARLLQPLFTISWPDAPRDQEDRINNAIKFAESFAAGRKFLCNDDSRISSIAAGYATEAFAVAEATLIKMKHTVNAAVANAAARAAAFAANAVADKASSIICAANAVSALTINSILRQELIEKAWLDFELLKKTAEAQGWTDETTVPLSIFAQMREVANRSSISNPNLPSQLTQKSTNPCELSAVINQFSKNLYFYEDKRFTLSDVNQRDEMQELPSDDVLFEIKAIIRDATKITKDYFKGKSRQELAKAVEMLANALEKLGQLNIKSQERIDNRNREMRSDQLRAIHDTQEHFEKMYNLATDRRRQTIENIELLLKCYLELQSRGVDVNLSAELIGKVMSAALERELSQLDSFDSEKSLLPKI